MWMKTHEGSLSALGGGEGQGEVGAVDIRHNGSKDFLQINEQIVALSVFG